MTSVNIIAMIVIPAALLGALGLVLISGRLSVGTRRRVELVLAGIFYPALIGVWGWQAFEAVGRRDWLLAILYGFLVVFVAVQGLKVVRKRRLLPSRAKA